MNVPEETGEETAVGTGAGQQPSAVGTETGQQPSAVETGEKTGYVKCPVCRETVTEQGKGTHFRNRHSNLPYDEYKNRFESAPPPPKETGETGLEKKESIYKGEVKANEILRNILEKHPDIPGKVVDEIMDWAQFGDIQPYLVTQLLMGMKGISNHTASLVGFKYQMALSALRGEAPPQWPPMMGIPQQQGGFNMPWPTPQTQQPPAYGLYQNVPPNSNARGSDKGRVFTVEDFEHMMNEREKRSKEENEKNALMETLNLVRRGMDNLNARVSGLEQGGGVKKPSEEGGFDKRIWDAIAKDTADRITGAKGELKPDQIRTIVSDEVRKHASPPPSGKRNQYDMEVEKATHNAEARKIEAEEKRKGYEAIAAGIRDGFGSLGWNIGAGASGGPTRSGPSPEAQTEARAPTTEPQPMEWRDGLWYTHCVYSDCRAPMAFEDGKSTVMCPSCRRVIQVQPTEEELKQKVQPEETPKVEKPAEAPKEAPEKPEAKPGKPEKEPKREEEKPTGATKATGNAGGVVT